jgi:hypothetical protein
MIAAAVLIFARAAGPVDPDSHKGWNAAAEAVARLSRPLGIDFEQRDSKGRHPAREDVDAYNEAGFGAWLDSQVKTPDDSIDQPPASIRRFLDDRADTVWAVIAALEKDAPEWGSNVPARPYLQLLRLEKVLLTIALIAERDREPIEASRALEASWSLVRDLDGPTLMDQVIFLAAEKLQVGVVRKMHEVPVVWLGRLGRDDPWHRMLQALAHEWEASPPGDSMDEIRKAPLKSIAI